MEKNCIFCLMEQEQNYLHIFLNIFNSAKYIK